MQMKSIYQKDIFQIKYLQYLKVNKKREEISNSQLIIPKRKASVVMGEEIVYNESEIHSKEKKGRGIYV